MKVLDSCSTSESDDRYYEPNVQLKNPDSKLYRRQKYTEETSKMVSAYTKQRDINDVDARLLVGIVTKVPVPDLPKDSSKEDSKGRTNALVSRVDTQVNISHPTFRKDEILNSHQYDEEEQQFKMPPTRSKNRVQSIDDRSQSTVGIPQTRSRNYKDFENSMQNRTVEFVDSREVMQPGRNPTLNFPTESDMDQQVISQLEDPNFLRKLDNDTVDELVSVLDNAKRRQSMGQTQQSRQPVFTQTHNEFDYRQHYPDAVRTVNAHKTQGSSFRP